MYSYLRIFPSSSIIFQLYDGWKKFRSNSSTCPIPFRKQNYGLLDKYDIEEGVSARDNTAMNNTAV